MTAGTILKRITHNSCFGRMQNSACSRRKGGREGWEGRERERDGDRSVLPFGKVDALYGKNIRETSKFAYLANPYDLARVFQFKPRNIH